MESRGQATVELLALLVVMAVILVAVAPRLGGLAATLAAHLDGGPPARTASDRALALAAAALRGEPTAPTVEDAAVLLGDELGPDAAARALDAMAARELAPLQIGADPGSPEQARPGPVLAHVVTAREERAYRAVPAPDPPVA